jgi:hypothetical protein
MAAQVKEVAKAGRSTGRAVTLAPPARRLLEGPVLPTLFRLAAPTVALMLLQAVIAAGEAVFVGRLGSAALADVSLPCVSTGDVLATMENLAGQDLPRFDSLCHSGQARNAIAATRRSSARLAPPTAWTAIP